MERLIGTTVYGLRGPIINNGDNIAKVASEVIINCANNKQFEINDRDIFALTESVVARAQGNYVHVDDIAEDIKNKYGTKVDNLGLVFPILSRNRFSMMLKGFAKAAKKITIQFSYPSDEVGNHFISEELMDEMEVDPYRDVFTEAEWIDKFGKPEHTFTGVNYLEFYRSIVEAEGAEFEAVLANDAREILKHTDTVLLCDIHSRFRNLKKLHKTNDQAQVLTLSDILTSPINGSGFNSKYGLLGSNKSNEDQVKLFPEECVSVVNDIQKMVKDATGKTIEVMIYGDGAFKDPIGQIWELADPVVSPAYTAGLDGQPNELKLKYLADNDYKNLSADEQKLAIEKAIKAKSDNLKGQMKTEGTTPRRLTDLLGSLCDLTSGSGDKGTPFIYIKGYFDNYAD
ncbi:MAG: coenzyme F420-0:L-glutamate ligase [Erysipelotrichaceae bacterium]|nr:coenzyme F420-0:L-glutamate ligase [Erysipelotrichaceae bacterium]